MSNSEPTAPETLNTTNSKDDEISFEYGSPHWTLDSSVTKPSRIGCAT
jgi:hypothetical protein